MYTRRDRNSNRAEYNVFRSADMTDMAIVLGDVVKLGAHMLGFCVALQLALS